MNGNLIIKNASELVTCSGFTAKKGKEMSKLGIIADGSAEVEVESINANTSINTIAASTVQSKPLENSVPASAVAAPQIIGLANSENSDTGIYLQLGAFKTQDAAEAYLAKMRSELSDNGKQLKLTNKDGLVRVHIGPYANQSEARIGAESMESKLGFKPMVNLP